MKWISPAMQEKSFTSPYDKTRQTYLVAEFRAGSCQSAPLLIFFLHGALSHQEQGMTSEIYHNAFGRLAEWMANRNVIYICPEYRGNSWMGPAAEEDLREIFRLTQKCYRPVKTLLTGGSMGGTSALIFASRNPGLIDGILAFCPATDVAVMALRFSEHFNESYGGPPDQFPGVYQDRSVRYHVSSLAPYRLAIIHGSEDTIIPVEHSRELVAALQAADAPVRYHEIEGGDHDSPVTIDYLPLLDWVAKT
jgi:dipeptidyl aminopeptidase/acylaminoacyl peptidase